MSLNKIDLQDAYIADHAKKAGIIRLNWGSPGHLHASLPTCIYTPLVVRARGVAAVEVWWGLRGKPWNKPTV